MKRLWTPLQIELLLHYYSSCAPFPRIHAPACSDETIGFVGAGIIVATPNEGANTYRTTELGRAWVELILSTDLPKAAFVDAHGNVINLCN